MNDIIKQTDPLSPRRGNHSDKKKKKKIGFLRIVPRNTVPGKVVIVGTAMIDVILTSLKPRSILKGRRGFRSGEGWPGLPTAERANDGRSV